MKKEKLYKWLLYLVAAAFIVILLRGVLFILGNKVEEAERLVIAAFALVFVALLVELEKEFRLLRRTKKSLQLIYNHIKKTPGYFTKATPKQNWLTRFSSAHPRFAICALFLVVTCIFLLPILFQMQSAVYGLPGDTWSSMWWQWWKDYARENNLDFLKVSLVNAPFGLDNTGFPFQVLQVLAYDYLYKVAGPYLYRNILTLFSFFLSALFTYMLVHYLTRSRLAGAVSGVVFALSPYHLFHAYQHLDLANIQWIPLFALSLVKLVSEVEHYSDWKKLLKNVVFCTVSYALVVFENYYYGYMLAILTLSFLIIYLIYRSTWKLPQYHGKKVAIALVLTLLLVTIVVLPFIYGYVKTFAAQPEGISSQKPPAYSRLYPQLFFFSAHLRDYYLPPVDHPLWGGGVERIVSKFKDYDNLFENTLFLGYLPLLLTALAL
ncbi:MAG: YfhO family protein, partial [Acidobacteriota bacterium]